ncbi:MAG: BACON domain-containing protein [Deltaproteobacteria bacterium]|nr:BACON domain-containing protein [Deltaproteobacteria bacterium]
MYTGNHAVRHLFFVALLTLSFTSRVWAQLYGASPFENELYALNFDTGAAITTTAITVPGRTITGINALTIDPTTGIAYAIVKASAVTGRLLITVNLQTAVGVEKGNLGDNFSTLAFREDGQLFGATGNGATVPETLYLIDKTNATKTLAVTLGAGADGEIIAYNPNDDFFYHWSGNGTVIFEKIMSVSPYTATNIPITGTTSGEVFGAVWVPCLGAFLASNISSSFNIWQTDGTVEAAFGVTPDDIRGVAILSYLTPFNQVVPAAGGNQSVDVVTLNPVTPPLCSWSAVSNAPWLTITGGTPDTGNGTITYSVAPNPGPNPRRGTLTIIGQTFTVSQQTPVPSPCTLTLPSPPAAISAAASVGLTMTVTASTATCAWSAKSHVSWITITAGASGSGTGTVTYNAAQNLTGLTRAGRITVNGKRFTVTQNP